MVLTLQAGQYLYNVNHVKARLVAILSGGWRLTGLRKQSYLRKKISARTIVELPFEAHLALGMLPQMPFFAILFIFFFNVPYYVLALVIRSTV